MLLLFSFVSMKHLDTHASSHGLISSLSLSFYFIFIFLWYRFLHSSNQSLGIDNWTCVWKLEYAYMLLLSCHCILWKIHSCPNTFNTGKEVCHSQKIHISHGQGNPITELPYFLAWFMGTSTLLLLYLHCLNNILFFPISQFNLNNSKLWLTTRVVA